MKAKLIEISVKNAHPQNKLFPMPPIISSVTRALNFERSYSAIVITNAVIPVPIAISE